jgi:hypothetical protein
MAVPTAVAVEKKKRTLAGTMRMYQQIQATKRDLIKNGQLSGDASPEQVVRKLEQLMAALDE